jgi:hypothetical protein
LALLGRTKDKRQKAKDKSGCKIPLPGDPALPQWGARGGLEDVKKQKARSKHIDGKEIQETCQ